MGRTYTDAERTEALALYDEHGAAETARRLGIPIGTVASWACRAGASLHAKDTSAAVAANRSRIVAKLRQIAELGADIELAMLESGEVSLRDVVGARTRAIHDLQLLSGEPTERAETLDRDASQQRLAKVLELSEHRQAS